MKPYDCAQTNYYCQIGRITWNHIIISVRQEYLNPCYWVQIICISKEFLISSKWMQKKKTLTKQLHKKCANEYAMKIISSPLHMKIFQGDQTYSSDYKLWELEPRKIPIVTTWNSPTGKMERKLTFARDYTYKKPRLGESFMLEFARLSEELFDDFTGNRDECIEHGLPE